MQSIQKGQQEAKKDNVVYQDKFMLGHLESEVFVGHTSIFFYHIIKDESFMC